MPMAQPHIKASPARPSPRVGPARAGGNPRPKRRHQARHRLQVAPVTLALRLQQFVLLAQNEPIGEQPHSGAQHQESQAAGHGPEADCQEDGPQVQRIAQVAIRTIGHQAVGVQLAIMHHRALEVGRRPEPDPRGQHRRQGAQSKNRAHRETEPVRPVSRYQARNGYRQVDAIQPIAGEPQRENARNEPEPLPELEFGRAKRHKPPLDRFYRARVSPPAAKCIFTGRYGSHGSTPR